MNYEVEKRVYKDTEKLPLYAQEAADEELERIEKAADFESLTRVSDIRRIEGTEEPYYRLKFGKYRYLLYYDAETELLKILRLTHRKDSYKKQNLPWRR